MIRAIEGVDDGAAREPRLNATTSAQAAKTRRAKRRRVRRSRSRRDRRCRRRAGAFLSPLVLRCDRPLQAERRAHAVEAFGPVTHADGLRDARRSGRARRIAAAAAWSRRSSRTTATPPMRSCSASHRSTAASRGHRSRLRARESTGHGSPLGTARPWRPGPRRRRRGDGRHSRRLPLHAAHRHAGLAAAAHDADRTMLAPGADGDHATRASVQAQLRGTASVGETIETAARTITLDDIEHFAALHRRPLLRPHG